VVLLLQLDELSKRYDPPSGFLRYLVKGAAVTPVEALQDVTFEVQPGEVVGLIGPNGAGKTTMLRIIATLLLPTSGAARVGGVDVVRHPREACRQLGLVLEGDRGIYDRLTGQENLEFFGAMAGLSPAAARARAAELLDVMELAERDKLAFGYSAGMRARLSIARSLMADPPLLVLDEPTRSLDPIAGRLTGDLITALAARGRAVLIANHRLDEVAATCHRVVVLIGGRVRYDGPVDDAEGPGGAAALNALLDREVGREVGREEADR
jgi:ABC-2 type transport system ATP-binding protein